MEKKWYLRTYVFALCMFSNFSAIQCLIILSSCQLKIHRLEIFMKIMLQVISI